MVTWTINTYKYIIEECQKTCRHLSPARSRVMHPDKCKYLLPHGWAGFSKSVSGTWQIPLGTFKSVEQLISLAQFLTHTHIDNDQFSTRLTYSIASASVVQRLRDSDAATVFREFEEFMSCTHRGPHGGASQSGLLKMTSHNFQRNMLDKFILNK